MFDWLRNRGKSEAEKRAEMLTAYVDSQLSPREAARFEAQLAQDAGLRADLEAERGLKQQLRSLPRMRAPRNFTLNPSDFPAREPSLAEVLYPRLRLATAVAAVLLVGVLSLDALTPVFAPQPESAASVALEPNQIEMTAEPDDVVAFETTTEEVADDAAAAAIVIDPLAEEVEEGEAELAFESAVAADSAPAEEEAGEQAAAAEAPPPEADAEAPAQTAPAATAVAEESAEPGTADAGVAAAPLPSATAEPTPTAQPTQELSAPRPEATPTLVVRAQETESELEPIQPTATPAAVSGISEAPEALPNANERLLNGEEAVVDTSAQPELQVVDWLRVLQISLGALVAGLLLATLLLRRRM